ncbi:MAG: tripartite tricarboxylate transporter substrate binding protein [Hyphomicrobiales bacterium]|nr:tripartite tricarboxylate transporter substrate binding protein [Hyphomicrobiales bacterium]
MSQQSRITPPIGGTRLNRRRVVSLLAAAGGWPLAAGAQSPWPIRPVKILVPTVAGGAPDIAARLLGQYLTEATGQPFVIENRAGANGNIAMIEAVKAAPDGYTLLLGADSYITINPHIYSKLTINPVKDFIPVASVAANDFVLAVNPNVPAHTLRELVDYARNANPPMSFGSAGYGSQHQLAMEMLKRTVGIDLLHVPFRGGTPATTATIAGEVQMLFAGGSSRPQVKAGLLRPIASTGRKRAQDFPDLPTIGEHFPGYVVEIWLGLFTAVGTPEPIVATLRGLTSTIMARPDFAARLATGGLEPLALSASGFSDLIQQDYEKYGKLTREIGIKLD